MDELKEVDTSNLGEIEKIVNKDIKQYKDIYDFTPEELLVWLESKFYVKIPSSLESMFDMQEASRLISKLSNDYTYLTILASYSRIYVRNEKRKGKDFKSIYEDMIDKKEIINDVASAVKQQYQAISRMVTIKKEINEELKLTGTFVK